MRSPAVTKGIRFPVDLHDWINEQAQCDDRAFSKMVVRLLREAKEEKERKTEVLHGKGPVLQNALQFNLEPAFNNLNDIERTKPV